jgi:hypothetical protein
VSAPFSLVEDEVSNQAFRQWLVSGLRPYLEYITDTKKVEPQEGETPEHNFRILMGRVFLERAIRILERSAEP